MLTNRKFHNRPKLREKIKRTKPSPVGYSIDSRYAWIERDIHHHEKKQLGQYMQLYIVLDDREYRDRVILEPVKWSKHNHRLYTHFGKEKIYAHEIAWYLEHGVMPGPLRFKDGDTTNYAISNLEERVVKPYQARVRVGSEIRCLGSYLTREEAVAAQDAFKALRAMGIV